MRVSRRTAVVAVVAVCLVAGAAGCRESESSEPERAGPGIAARIDLPSSPFAIAVGEGSVWVLTRSPRAAVWRIDPKSNRVVGTPTALPVAPWSIAVGAGSVWVTPNGADGRLIRIDARTGRISAAISARPIYFGSVIALGGGAAWTGNDDERYRHGSTVSKIDTGTDRVVGTLALGSPQSVAFGHGALWVADHAGWLVKIDAKRFDVVARRRLRFGPHGVVVTAGAVYVADAHGRRLLEADPKTAAIRRTRALPIGPIYPAFGGGSLWTGSAAAWERGREDDRVARIDPRTLRVAETFHVGSNTSGVAFGFGSVWAALPAGQVVRITPERG